MASPKSLISTVYTDGDRTLSIYNPRGLSKKFGKTTTIQIWTRLSWIFILHRFLLKPSDPSGLQDWPWWTVYHKSLSRFALFFRWFCVKPGSSGVQIQRIYIWNYIQKSLKKKAHVVPAWNHGTFKQVWILLRGWNILLPRNSPRSLTNALSVWENAMLERKTGYTSLVLRAVLHRMKVITALSVVLHSKVLSRPIRSAKHVQLHKKSWIPPGRALKNSTKTTGRKWLIILEKPMTGMISLISLRRWAHNLQ